MKVWQKAFCIVLIVSIAATAILLSTQNKKECCLCSSFRYHAPCLIDLETGKMIELDLYFPHETLVAELADPQPEMGTFSFVSIGNVSGTKLTDSKVIELSVPLADKTSNPALCKGCRRLLPSGYSGRYILADLYDKEIKELTYSYLEGKWHIQKSLVYQWFLAFLTQNRVPVFYESCPLFFECVSPLFYDPAFWRFSSKVLTYSGFCSSRWR